MDSFLVTGISGFLIGGALSWVLKNRLTQKFYLIKHAFKNEGILNIKMVLVARNDLAMSKGKLAAQCAHAAVSCYAASKQYNPEALKAWEASGQAKVVVRCNIPGDDEIFRLSKEAEKLNVISAIVRDAGHTQLPSGTITVLGLGPANSVLLDKISGHLKLY